MSVSPLQSTRPTAPRSRRDARMPRLKRTPIAHAVALLALAGSVAWHDAAHSQAWFAASGASKGAAFGAEARARAQGVGVNSAGGAAAQQAAARRQLNRSIDNLSIAAQAIAAQQAAQAAARDAALAAGGVPDGLAEGGLKVDSNALTAGWRNARAPVQSTQANGGKTVTIEQTGAKAILNWETFNVGRNTTVDFKQQSSWAVLNRVNDPRARPSQIQGRIDGDGTVMVVNRNGVVFSGSSQVNVRNLAAAAVDMADAQFDKGLYGDILGGGQVPTFANDLVAGASGFTYGNATADVRVEPGASLRTRAPGSVTEGGGYVLLAGREVLNQGLIETPAGQAVLAAGDAFAIRKGQGSDGNLASTTRGNEITALRNAGGAAGLVRNTGMIVSPTGDISLTGRDVRQEGVAVATTSVNARGTIHLSADRIAGVGKVTLASGGVTSILLDESPATALDAQRDALLRQQGASVARRDQSLVEIGASDIGFEGGSLTLATGGQIFADATRRTDVAEGARIDVSGAVGVQVAMAANNVQINVQGNEQRDAPINRDGDNLRNSDIWIDRRQLVHVPAGTNGYEGERWYTAGGLLEVSGYLGISGHSIGEWAAQGGTVQFSGGEVVTQRGSSINLAGGTLDVQGGRLNLTWLRGADGRLYEASTAPGDLLYRGLYQGYEDHSERWDATTYWRNPLIGPDSRYEQGYTVGRDAGRLVVATRTARLQGEVDASVFQGQRQTQRRDAALDGYDQLQGAVPRRAELVVGAYLPVYDKNSGALGYVPEAVAGEVAFVQDDEQAPLDAGQLQLDAAWLNALRLGGLQVYAKGSVQVDAPLSVDRGGEVGLHALRLEVNRDITARGGSIVLGDQVRRFVDGKWQDDVVSRLTDYAPGVVLGEGATLDVRGLWTNLRLDASQSRDLGHADGGSVSLLSTGGVTLQAGSLIDASSGAVLRRDGSLAGGKGGDITLRANIFETRGDGTGQLVLNGELRGHGVRGGGALRLDSGGGAVIGSAPVGDVLAAGQPAAISLIVREAFDLPAGTVLTGDFSYNVDTLKPGSALDVLPDFSQARPYTLAADWVVPSMADWWDAMSVRTLDGGYYSSGSVVPRGAVLVSVSAASTRFAPGTLVAADAFPGGMPIKTQTRTVAAGTPFSEAVTVPAGRRLQPGTQMPVDVAVHPLLKLDAGLFRTGFASYDVRAHQGVYIAADGQVEAVMPVLRADLAAARTAASGADPGSVLRPVLLPLWQQNAESGLLTQRAGASLALTAGATPYRGALRMEQGASLTVDPGSAIVLTGNGQITLDGELTAHGGRIAVLPGSLGVGVDVGDPLEGPLVGVSAQSLWIGEHARLDASGLAQVAIGVTGRRYGIVQDGGRIELGTTLDLETDKAVTANGFLVVRPGARLDASGAAAVLDMPGRAAVDVAGAGGAIVLGASNGLYIDGSLNARAGGAGAAAGILSLALETPVLGPVARFTYLGEEVPDALRVPRELVLEQVYAGSGLAADAQPGRFDAGLAYGHARYGVDAIHAGGFGTVSLYVNGLLGFAGDVDLRLPQALYLTVSAMGLAEEAPSGSQVRLAAPYVRLTGSGARQGDGYLMPNPVFGSRNASAGVGTLGVAKVAAGSSLQLLGDHLDLVGQSGLGARGEIIHNSGTPLAVLRDAFDDVLLSSTGDLRLLGATFYSPGDLVLRARQIYGNGTVVAGRRGDSMAPGVVNVDLDPARSLSIERVGDTLPAMPYSVFGQMQFSAYTVNQGGVLRAPLGSITLGGDNADSMARHVNLLPGSVTSVSAAGLTMPYGGTVDGLTYAYDGVDVVYQGVGGEPAVVFKSAAVHAQEGALIDLSGGGTLTGAAFLTGRGGSTDARLYPLVQADAKGGGFNLPSLSTNPVYAIVPGVQAGYAPVAAEQGAGDPALGRQVTIEAGVPGLPAGTYTLLPSTYALLPGAFRVEFNGSAQVAPQARAYRMRNGSWSATAQLSTINTSVRQALPTQVILTAADTLRRYSQYNETSYAAFAVAQAAREGVPRPLLERDAKALLLGLQAPSYARIEPLAALEFAATLDGRPAEGGRGSVAYVLGTSHYEVLADGAAPTQGFDGVSVHGRDLNALGVSRLVIGGRLASTYTNARTGSTQLANVIAPAQVNAGTITLRSGASLRAGEVFLMTNDIMGGITLERGAQISTLGQGAAYYDANQGYIYQPGATSILALSNGLLDMLPPSVAKERVGAGSIEIGLCAADAACTGTTRLYSEGTITAVTDNRFVLGDAVRYGTRNLILAVGGVNVGSDAVLADAATRGLLPAGMSLSQAVLDRLLQGDTGAGAPALENLVLAVRESVNFYDSVRLSTLDAATGRSALQRLVLTTPAIYGMGGPDAVALIETDTLVWNGATTAPGGIVAGGPGTGAGTLRVDARQIEFGYGPKTQSDSVRSHARLALGFAAVDLDASERITANHSGSLAVYQSRSEWDETINGYTYQGGALNLRTPLLTGQAGSVNRLTAGGDIRVVMPQGAIAPSVSNASLTGALGAEISLDSRFGALVLDSAVLLPSGKLTLAAQDTVTLADNAQLDLAGRRIDFYDVSKYSWGGDVALDSRAGGIVQSAASRIDLSAQFNRAGKLGAYAPQGVVELAGALMGGSSGYYDAGGTLVPFAAGAIDIHASQIAGFADLNQRLTGSGVTGGRSFRIGQGDLTVGGEVKAREVNIALDQGHLTVAGRIDASGEQAGSIRLAAGNGVTLAGGAVLDASASVLRVDSYGQPIEAPNRAVIEIDAGQGVLTLASGTRMNLAVSGASARYGTVSLNAPRVGDDDVGIEARGAITIDGARSITVNAFVTDDTARVGDDRTADGKTYQVIDKSYLDGLHGGNLEFIGKALANGDLMNNRLAGLRAYADQFHLRPGVQIVSNAARNPDGNLHIEGDIDLSGYRYASVNPHTRMTAAVGSGEAGALVFRAQGDLAVYGSLSDGFDGARVISTIDEQGWILTAGHHPYAGDVVVPHGGLVTLAEGTFFQSGKVLNYDLPMQPMSLAAGTLLPATAELAQPLTLAAGTVLGGAVYGADGALLFGEGAVLATPLDLPQGAKLGAGLRLPVQAHIAAMTWPAGVALPFPVGYVKDPSVLPFGDTVNGVQLARALPLSRGAVIPSETYVLLPDGALTVDLRPRDASGSQGRNLAVAPMLPSGSQSWDLTLVGGADLAAADRLAVARPAAGHAQAGRVLLSDNHFGMGMTFIDIPGTGTPPVYRFSDDFDPSGFEWIGIPFLMVPGAEITEEQVLTLYDYLGGSPLELNNLGLGHAVDMASPGTPADQEVVPAPLREQLFSVVRTGTGDLRMVSGGDIVMGSLYGVYTAGTQSASLAASGGADPYDLPRGVSPSLITDGEGYTPPVLGREAGDFENLVNGGAHSVYHAWYPESGGNLLVRAGGSIMGDAMGPTRPRQEPLGMAVLTLSTSDSLGNWLWRQGSGSVQTGQNGIPTAWWINFGTYVDPAIGLNNLEGFIYQPRLIGFTGFGTLGGGNFVLEAGQSAGMLQSRGDWGGYYTLRSQGLNLAVASTGRVTASGELVQTGGGDLDIRIGGGLNPDPATRSFSGSSFGNQITNLDSGTVQHLELNGTFTNLRGALRLQAGSVGGVELRYGAQDPQESRPLEAYTASSALTSGGPVLMLGDAGARLEARGDLVLAGVGDPGRVEQRTAGTPYFANGESHASGGWSWFSLWTPSTAVDLLAAGGNLTPTLGPADADVDGNLRATDRNFVYPSVLRAAAASGSIYYGSGDAAGVGVVLAPSPVDPNYQSSGTGQLELLAAGSLYAGGKPFSVSSADPAALPDPFDPGFIGEYTVPGGGRRVVHNVSADAVAPAALVGTTGSGVPFPLFSFAAPTASGHVVQGLPPARYYAVEGDLVGLRLGSIVYRGNIAGQPGDYSTWYEGGGPVAIRAGRDIVNSGTALGTFDFASGGAGGLGWTTIPLNPLVPLAIGGGTSRGNLIVHASADDVSVVQADRDIRYSTFYIAGPGLLDISAGRDVYMADKGELRSLGPVVNVSPNDRGSGATIAVAAGVGAQGPDWAGFAARYLDPARQADPSAPFADQPGRALTIYDGELTLEQWLAREFGYDQDRDQATPQAYLQAKQAELDAGHARAVAAGGTASSRSLTREYRLESQLHLVNWLQERFGGANRLGLHFEPGTTDARAFFAALPAEQRSAFLRGIYYAELRLGGREYNDEASRRFGSYLRGREAIATLFPGQDYAGNLTMFSNARYYDRFVDPVITNRPQTGVTYLREDEWIAAGSPPETPFYKVLDAGIHTDFGGGISILAPGGRALVGVDGGFTPGEGSGVLTQGEGDIGIYSRDSILLGQSRIFTTFGGNVLAWSAQGDINAGRGAKTTVVYTPQRRVYDDLGNVALSPNTPNTGAGIATLNPIPEVPPGDVDLIAPLGTIDAGEAGIRVSGNVNIAALHVVNAANIQVQGESQGIPVMAAVNVGALSNASAAATSAATSAQDAVARSRAAAQKALPSIISVQVLGFGSERAAPAAPRQSDPSGAAAPAQPAGYSAQSMLQMVGRGEKLTPAQLARLSAEERRKFGL
ncbi:filamentous haemagglutinin family protein [Bordetella ansorpii]|nr:filamentous haemagglutinin family protein [Bordetella ansorpii]